MQYFKSSSREYFMFYIFTTPSLRGLSLSISLSKNEQRSRAAQLKVLLHLQRIPSALFVFFLFYSFPPFPQFPAKGRRGLSSAAGWPRPHWSQLYAQMNFTRLKQASTACAAVRRTQPLDSLQPVLKEPPSLPCHAPSALFYTSSAQPALFHTKTMK